MRLWNVYDGEPFLDNPYLFTSVNPRPKRRAKKKGVRNMARRRNRKGQFVKGNAPARKRSRRRRHSVARRRIRVVRHPALVNPRRRHRRRSYVARRRHRRYARRNPVFGNLFSGNTLKMVAFTGAGLAGVPFVEGFIASAVPQIYPADPSTRKLVSYGVKIASAWGLSWGVGKIAGHDAGRATLIGGLAFVAVTALRDLGVFGLLTPATTTGTGKYLRGAGSQPLLGRYPSMGLGSQVTSHTANRLNPANRY